jgi:hypothetical protein
VSIVLFYVLFVCKCVQYYCHRVATQLQLNIYSVILSVLDPRKCEYLKDYSLDFEHAYMTAIYEHFQHLL